MKKTLFLLLCFLCFRLGAQPSFAVFVDEGTYNACKNEIAAYRNAVEKDGLATCLFHDQWASPEEVKHLLHQQYQEEKERGGHLEGAVFIGDIPIAMIQGAQHLTSAFKMDEERFPSFESAVPSDRFYDDFRLKFQFLGRDSTRHHLFYYRLAGDSPQQIQCTLYSGRIRSTKTGEAAYEQIRNYLRKVVAEREVENPLDRVVSYTGEGSFSNSLAAWKDERITLQEQIPAAFNDADGAKFYMFYMYPYMKQILTQELRRNDVDLMLFHEHGTPDRQYLTGNPIAAYEDDCYSLGRMGVRRYLRNIHRTSTLTLEQAKARLVEQYGLDSTWFQGIDDSLSIAQDSLEDLKTGIVLEDIRQIRPNPRVVVFDACYNGDFRDGDFVAGEYIFSEGKTIACFGNSVNVLQDKSATDLMGMLAVGMRIGEWAQQIAILESHIIGDPTFHFAQDPRYSPVQMHSTDTLYWHSLLEGEFPPDIQSLALYKLFQLNDNGLSDRILSTYRTSPYYTRRLQCLHLLAHYNDDNYPQLLKEASQDPYEFIRRKALYFMGRVGRNDFIPDIVRLYMSDYMAERIAFNLSFTAHHLNVPLLKNFFDQAIDQADYLYDKEAFRKQVNLLLTSSEQTMIECWKRIVSPSMKPQSRMFYLTMLRNNPFPQMVGDILIALKNPNEDASIRRTLAEGLGWYVRAYNKEEIILGCREILENEKDLDPDLAEELTKTINRLKDYSR